MEDQVKETQITKSSPAATAKEPQERSKMELDLGMDFNSIIKANIESFLDKKIKADGEDLVLKVIQDKIDEGMKKVKPVFVKVNTKEYKKIEGTPHKKFKEALFFAVQEKQLYIAGPAGSGKTTLGHHIAQSLSSDFAHISCSAGTSEAHLLGRMLFDGTYVQSDLVRLYENGGVFLFDEIDAADANTLLVINSALANGKMNVPNRKDNPTAIRHENFICLVAANTWGNGSAEYHGRNYLDAAFLDRFAVSKIFIDYDEDLEMKICDHYQDLYNKIKGLRQKVEANKIKRIISTRIFVSATRQTMAGRKWEEIFETITLGWSEEERKKVK